MSDDNTIRFGVPQGQGQLSVSYPQGSVIGPKRFIEYVEDVDGLFQKHRLRHQLLTDDKRGLKSGPPTSVPDITSISDASLRQFPSDSESINADSSTRVRHQTTSPLNWTISSRWPLGPLPTFSFDDIIFLS